MKQEILQAVFEFLKSDESQCFKKQYPKIAKQLLNIGENNIRIFSLPPIKTGTLSYLAAVDLAAVDLGCEGSSSIKESLPTVELETPEVYSITQDSLFKGSPVYHCGERAMTDLLLDWLLKDGVIEKKVETDFSLMKSLMQFVAFKFLPKSVGDTLERKGYYVEKCAIRITGVSNEKTSYLDQRGIAIVLKDKKIDCQILIGYYPSEDATKFVLKLQLLNELSKSNIVFNAKGGNNIRLVKGLFGGWKLSEGLYEGIGLYS